MKNKLSFFLMLLITSCSQISFDFDLQQALNNGQWESAVSMLQSIPKSDPNYSQSKVKLKELKAGLTLFKQNHFWVSPLQNGQRVFFDIEYHSYNNYYMKIDGNTVYNGVTKKPLMRYVGYINNRSIKIMDVGYYESMTGIAQYTGKTFDCFIGKP